MLPLWRNELRVVLCSDRVILLGLGKGVRRKVIHQTLLPCSALPGVPAWQAALDVFKKWLANNEINRTDVTVLLSNHFVRYALMPFSIEVTNRAESQAFAQMLFENIYGELARQWRLQIEVGGYGESRLVAAVDMLLLDQITETVALSRLKLRAITPHLVAVFNCFQPQIKEADGLFVVAEPEQLIVVTFNHGKLSDVRRVLLNGALDAQLTNLLRREALTSGLDLTVIPVYLHVAGNPDFSLPIDESMNIHYLKYVEQHGGLLCAEAAFDMVHAGGYV